MALLTPRWGLVLDGISSDGSTLKGLQSIRFLTKAEPCDESLFDPKQNRWGAARRTALVAQPERGDRRHIGPGAIPRNGKTFRVGAKLSRVRGGPARCMQTIVDAGGKFVLGR